MISLLLASMLLAAGDGRAEVTAYCDTRPGIMASGKHVYAGACAGPRSVPLGTIVLIAGKRYVVEDRTAWWVEGRYDIWRPWSKAKCLRWGKRWLPVRVLRKGRGRCLSRETSYQR